MLAVQTYRKIDDKCFNERIYSSDSNIGKATVVKPEPCTDAAMHKLAGQSPNTASPINSKVFPRLVGEIAPVRRQDGGVAPRWGTSEFLDQGTKDVAFCG